MDAVYKNIADAILQSTPCIVLSGAGISAESGIPTFRTPKGLWNTFDPSIYASIDVFRKDPSKYWQIRGDFIRNYDQYQPNAAHTAIAEMEDIDVVTHVITQNIDGLHKKAGSRRVSEIHGSLREIFCLSCGHCYLAPHIPAGDPPRCGCGGVLKPNTVLFGEQLPESALKQAYHQAGTCGSMLLIGTSAVVYPAAYLPVLAKQNGARIVEINLESNWPDADFYLDEKAGSALPKLLAAVKQARGNH